MPLVTQWVGLTGCDAEGLPLRAQMVGGIAGGSDVRGHLDGHHALNPIGGHLAGHLAPVLASKHKMADCQQLHVYCPQQQEWHGAQQGFSWPTGTICTTDCLFS